MQSTAVVWPNAFPSLSTEKGFYRRPEAKRGTINASRPLSSVLSAEVNKPIKLSQLTEDPNAIFLTYSAKSNDVQGYLVSVSAFTLGAPKLLAASETIKLGNKTSEERAEALIPPNFANSVARTLQISDNSPDGRPFAEWDTRLVTIEDQASVKLLLKVLHFDTDNIPEDMSLAQLNLLAELCVRYSCKKVLAPWVNNWYSRQRNLLQVSDHRWLLIGQTFGQKRYTATPTKELICSFTAASTCNTYVLNIGGKSERDAEITLAALPKEYKDFIFEQRGQLIAQIIVELRNFVAKFVSNGPVFEKCGSKTCSNLALGSLTQSLVQLNIWPLVVGDSPTEWYSSASQLFDTIKKIQIDSLDHGSGPIRGMIWMNEPEIPKGIPDGGSKEVMGITGAHTNKNLGGVDQNSQQGFGDSVSTAFKEQVSGAPKTPDAPKYPSFKFDSSVSANKTGEVSAGLFGAITASSGAKGTFCQQPTPSGLGSGLFGSSSPLTKPFAYPSNVPKTSTGTLDTRPISLISASSNGFQKQSEGLNVGFANLDLGLKSPGHNSSTKAPTSGQKTFLRATLVNPFIEKDQASSMINHFQHISFMSDYCKLSSEELRLLSGCEQVIPDGKPATWDWIKCSKSNYHQSNISIVAKPNFFHNNTNIVSKACAAPKMVLEDLKKRIQRFFDDINTFEGDIERFNSKTSKNHKSDPKGC